MQTDFMFQLTQIEWVNLKSQIVSSSWGGLRRTPFTFTEQGFDISLFVGSGGVVDGQWRQSGNDTRTFDPVDQARTTKYAIRKYVEADPRWRNSSRRRVRWAHLVALPNTDLHDDFSMPDCPRWAVHGTGDIADLASRLHDVAVRQETRTVPPSPGDVDLIVEILNGRHLPVLDISAEGRAR